MPARIPAFIAWSLAAACAVYWAMRLLAAPAGLPGAVQPVSIAGAASGDVALLFASPVAAAAAAPVTALASRFKLVGVMAPKNAERGLGQGIALIAVDGKPARPYRVGATVDESLVLRAVTSRSASLGPAAGLAILQLDMTPLTPPATGVRPPGAAGLTPLLGALRLGSPGMSPATAPPSQPVEIETYPSEPAAPGSAEGPGR